MGELSPDGGGVQFSPSDLRVAYLPQGLDAPDETPLCDVLYPLAAALRETEADVGGWRRRWHRRRSRAGRVHGRLRRRARTAGDAQQPGGLRRASAFWPGWAWAMCRSRRRSGRSPAGRKPRLGLAALLVNDPQLLILDEPTNHLDVTALEWLENWLKTFPAAR